MKIMSSHNENNYAHLCFICKSPPRNFFSILLDRYLYEFVYRFNGRSDGGLFTRTIQKLANAKALQFEQLTKTA